MRGVIFCCLVEPGVSVKIHSQLMSYWCEVLYFGTGDPKYLTRQQQYILLVELHSNIF